MLNMNSQFFVRGVSGAMRAEVFRLLIAGVLCNNGSKKKQGKNFHNFIK